jgi:hypothetical protein
VDPVIVEITSKALQMLFAKPQYMRTLFVEQMEIESISKYLPDIFASLGTCCPILE